MTLPLGEVKLEFSGQHFTLNSLPSDVTVDMPHSAGICTVNTYGAVMSAAGQLVNCGQYIRLESRYKVLVRNLVYLAMCVHIRYQVFHRLVCFIFLQ